MLAHIYSMLQDNNPFSEEYQEREQMEKMRESHGKQIPPGGPLEKPGSYYSVVNPFEPNEISHSYQLDQSISVLRIVGWYFSFLFKNLQEISVSKQWKI